MTTVLAFDCAVSGQGVAIVRDGETLACLFEEGRDQAARLLPAIVAALEAATVAKAELDLIAVTTGPGSFTGVRVGLSAAVVSVVSSSTLVAVVSELAASESESSDPHAANTRVDAAASARWRSFTRGCPFEGGKGGGR